MSAGGFSTYRASDADMWPCQDVTICTPNIGSATMMTFSDPATGMETTYPYDAAHAQ